MAPKGFEGLNIFSALLAFLLAGLFVSPGKSWVLERQGIYQVLVLLFDEHHHQVHAGKVSGLSVCTSKVVTA